MATEAGGTHQRLKPALRGVWDSKRTASLRGHRGRNVGWDFTLERMNLEVQEMLGTNVTPERIPEVIRVLNGIRRVKGPALDAFGIGSSELSEATGIAEADVKALVGHIKSALGFDGNDDAGKLFRNTASQPFRTGSGTPWGQVSDAETKESTKGFVERNLRSCVGNDMN